MARAQLRVPERIVRSSVHVEADVHEWVWKRRSYGGLHIRYRTRGAVYVRIVRMRLRAYFFLFAPFCSSVLEPNLKKKKNFKLKKWKITREL